MSETAEKTDPKLWDKVKKRVTQSSKGGEAGQWSARKAQMATSEYKREGGGYKGKKSDDNGLKQWTDEDWDTKSGKQSGETGERYLPKAARETLTDAEYARSTAKKRSDGAKGRQHSKQPADVARKSASARKSGRTPSRTKTSAGTKGGETKAALMEKARRQNVPGRSKMSKAELARAVQA